MTARELSLWHDTLVADGVDSLTPRPGLDGDCEADVVVVGAGYTGLWTAYYLLRHDPTCGSLCSRREFAGFGASRTQRRLVLSPLPRRRRGPGTPARTAAAACAMRRAMNATVDEVGAVVAAEGIDCHWRQGRHRRLARTPVQLARARAEVDEDAVLRAGEDDVELLGRSHRRPSTCGRTAVLGATYTPHCAAIHPARLARGLARRRRAAAASGSYERTRALRIRARGRRRPTRGTVRAEVRGARHRGLDRRSCPGSDRDVVPVYSLMVATRAAAGLVLGAGRAGRRETFSDHRHLIIYGQRTADDRLAFGGRGAPYHFGLADRAPLRPRPGGVRRPAEHAASTCSPRCPPTAFSHSWGGPLGIPRDWCASVGLTADRVGWAGGYVGDGVGTTNLAGRTLADLVLGLDSDLVHLPWVGHRSPRWEPEPLRWLGVNAGLRAMTLADAEERASGRASLAARVVAPMLGH